MGPIADSPLKLILDKIGKVLIFDALSQLLGGSLAIKSAGVD